MHVVCNRDGPISAHVDADSAMARLARKLAFGVAYGALILAWNWVCEQHYARQTERQDRRVLRHRASRPTRGHASHNSSRQTAIGASTPVAARTAGAVGADASTPVAARTAGAVGAGHHGAAASSSIAVDAGCGPLRPFHTLLTAQATVYQQWQSRIMYFHWRKQKAAAGPCTEMGGFTRLVASKDGEPDGLENEIPSAFVPEVMMTRPHRVIGR